MAESMRRSDADSDFDLSACLSGIEIRRPAALGELYDRTASRLYALAMGILEDTASADEVVADVYLAVWRGDGIGIAAPEGFIGRMLMLCRKLALTRARAAAATDIVSLEDEPHAADALSRFLPNGANARFDTLACRVVSLALFRGMSCRQIAAFTGISVADVEAVLRAALVMLEEVEGAVDLDSVLFTDRLATRNARAPDPAAENVALTALAEELAKPGGCIFSQLVNGALELCGAHTAGLSILESGPDGVGYRWNAVAGTLAAHQGGFLPRDESPCKVVMERNATQLMVRPDRHFPALRAVRPRLFESLLVPFRMLGQPVGTLWILAHDHDTHFDAEDARVMASMAAFASAAYVLRSSEQAAFAARDELIRANERLRRSNDLLCEELAAGRLVGAGGRS